MIRASSVLVTRTARAAFIIRETLHPSACTVAKWTTGAEEPDKSRTLGGTFYAQIKASSVDRLNSPHPVKAGGGGGYICIMYL